MRKRIAVLVVVVLLPVSAVAHTKLFYRMSCKSDYRKVEVTMVTVESTEVPTVEPTVTPLVEIPLESTLTPEPTFTLVPTEAPTEISSLTPCVESMDSEGAEEPSDQIFTSSDIANASKCPPTVLRQWMS